MLVDEYKQNYKDSGNFMFSDISSVVWGNEKNQEGSFNYYGDLLRGHDRSIGKYGNPDYQFIQARIGDIWEAPEDLSIGKDPSRGYSLFDSYDNNPFGKYCVVPKGSKYRIIKYGESQLIGHEAVIIEILGE